MKTTVIIVNYNTNKYLAECLKSLPDDIEIIVVDNNSVGKPKSSKAKIIFNDQNLGFARAVNIGLKNATGEYILLLNPDTKIYTEAINKMTDFYESQKDAGVVAPKLISRNNVVQKSVRKFPTIVGAFKEYILGQKGKYDFYLPAETCVVDVVVGACMLIKKDLLEKIGGLSEKYFLYYEDIDLCRKVKQAGFNVYFFPESIIYHEVGSSSTPKSYDLLVQSSKIYHGIINYLIIKYIIKLSQILKIHP